MAAFSEVTVTPKQSYDNVSLRARRFLRLHDGLVNTRQRGIRADWKSSFCKLMRWPQEADIDRVDSKDALLVLRNGSQLARTDFTAESLDDLLRAALSLGVSALDRYLHERVVKRIITSLKGPRLRRAQEALSIPATLALEMIDELKKASKGGRRVRPANQLRNALQESLHTRTFQSWREIEEAFELIGVGGFTGRLQKAYALSDIQPLRNQLGNLVQRRNFIVHEGDLVRHQRGGRCRVRPVQRKYVADSLDFLDTLVTHMEAIT